MNPGFYPASELPMAQYLSDPCPEPSLSSGAANLILTRSPAHVYDSHPRLGGRKDDDSNASDTGSVFHDLFLGGEGKICEIDPQMYRSKPTKDNPEGNVPVGYTNAAIREARDQARENGLTPILSTQMHGVRDMVATAKEFLAQSELAGVLNGGESEVTMLAQDGDVWLRARPDLLNHHKKVLLHVKTTQASASPQPFIRMAKNMGYDVALSFYRKVFELLTGQKDWLHVILCVEQTAPYACSLVSLDPAAWAIADQKVDRAIALWRKCMDTDSWPAYSAAIHYATPTAWELAEAEAMGVGDE